MAKKAKEKKLIRRMNAIPILIVIIFVVLHVTWIQNMQRTQSVNYVYLSKIHEGYAKTTEVIDAYRQLVYSGGEDLDGFFEKFSNINAERLIGIRILQNEEIAFEVGKSFPQNVYEPETKIGTFIDSNSPIYVDMEGNNELYLGFVSNFNFKYSVRPLKDFNPFLQYGKNPMNTERGLQDIWYEFPIDKDTKVLCGYTVAMTDSDYQLLTITNAAVHIVNLFTILAMVLIVARVVTSQTKLVNAYYQDRITGGKNWYYFLYHADRNIKAIKRKGNCCAMIQFRMEKYQNYCACYGEKEGEKLLSEIYDVMKNFLPKNTRFSRNENADFAILYAFDDEKQITTLVKDGVQKLKQLRPDASISFNAGVYIIEPEDGVDVVEAYNRAAIAREKSEETFSAEVVFFTAKMKDDIYWEKKMENDLERGLANEEFKIYLQPKYAVGTEKMVAAEALIRWEHPKEGFLGPYKFIPLYEKNGMILKIDDYMISHVAKLQSDYLKSGMKPVPISVNLSRIHFTNKRLAEHICELVDEYAVPHELIELELTESAFFDDKEVIIATANRLREYGFTVSLDDFGSGYSSLNSLRELPIDVLKLDSGFFRSGEMDEKTQVIIQEIIQLAKQLDIQIVAEGIEHKEQVEFLTEQRCDMIQGYYFAKPMPVEDFDRRMEKDAQ